MRFVNKNLSYLQKSRHIPAQAFDKVNENFFRTTFTSRSLDYLVDFYSFETEYNSPEGRCDFLAVPTAGSPKPAMLVEFKYFTNEAAEKGKVLDRDEPDAETVKQALDYRKALVRRPDWNHEIAATVVEVCGSAGYNWFDLRPYRGSGKSAATKRGRTSGKRPAP